MLGGIAIITETVIIAIILMSPASFEIFSRQIFKMVDGHKSLSDSFYMSTLELGLSAWPCAPSQGAGHLHSLPWSVRRPRTHGPSK